MLEWPPAGGRYRTNSAPCASSHEPQAVTANPAHVRTITLQSPCYVAPQTQASLNRDITCRNRDYTAGLHSARHPTPVPRQPPVAPARHPAIVALAGSHHPGQRVPPMEAPPGGPPMHPRSPQLGPQITRTRPSRGYELKVDRPRFPVTSCRVPCCSLVY